MCKYIQCAKQAVHILGITKSNSEARRLINAGSFKIDEQKFTELDVETDKLLNKTLQLGKRTFFTFI